MYFLELLVNSEPDGFKYVIFVVVLKPDKSVLKHLQKQFDMKQKSLQ